MIKCRIGAKSGAIFVLKIIFRNYKSRIDKIV